MRWATFSYRYVIESADQLMLAGVRVLWFLFSLWQIAGCLSSYTSGWGHRAARRVWTRRRHYTCTADTPERVCLWVYTLCVLNVPTFFWLQVIRAILQRSQQKMWILPVVCWRFGAAWAHGSLQPPQLMKINQISVWQKCQRTRWCLVTFAELLSSHSDVSSVVLKIRDRIKHTESFCGRPNEDLVASRRLSLIQIK